MRGAELFDRKRACFSINHSVLSGHDKEPNSDWSLLGKVSPPIQHKFLAAKRGCVNTNSISFVFKKCLKNIPKKALRVYVNNGDICKGFFRKPLYCF